MKYAVSGTVRIHKDGTVERKYFRIPKDKRKVTTVWKQVDAVTLAPATSARLCAPSDRAFVLARG